MGFAYRTSFSNHTSGWCRTSADVQMCKCCLLISSSSESTATNTPVSRSLLCKLIDSCYWLYFIALFMPVMLVRHFHQWSGFKQSAFTNTVPHRTSCVDVGTWLQPPALSRQPPPVQKVIEKAAIKPWGKSQGGSEEVWTPSIVEKWRWNPPINQLKNRSFYTI